jgi:hypothetical protein
MKRPRQLKDGDTIRIKNHTIIRDICCKCGTSHLVQYYISGQYIFATTWQDPQYNNRSTKAKLGAISMPPDLFDEILEQMERYRLSLHLRTPIFKARKRKKQ